MLDVVRCTCDGNSHFSDWWISLQVDEVDEGCFFMRCVSDLNTISDGHQSNDPAGTRGSLTLSALGQ